MRSLFWKIFLGFWLTVLLAGGIVWLLATLTRPETETLLERHLRFVARGLDGYSEDALNSLKKGGLAGWDAYRRAIPPEEPHPYILTGDLQPLLQPPAPPVVVHLARKVFAGGKVKILKRRRSFAIGRPLQLPDGRQAVLALHFRIPRPSPGAPPPHWQRRWLGGHPLGLAVFLLVSAGICLLLTRSLTRPIGRLRRATRDFAGGRLETRVGSQLRGNNELTRLGEDFDRMAEQIESLVTGQQRLLRDISHELRSPLARLGVALELARQKGPDQAAAALDRIEREAERLNALIEELLTLIRLEQPCQPAGWQQLDLVALLAEIEEDAAFEAEPEGIHIETRTLDSAPLTGQPELLRWAIEPVLRNAIRHSPRSGTIKLSLRQEGGDWLLSICDEGPGVSTEAMPHLFEPFYRADSARTPGSGTGLGLAIAARAVNLHGGSISAINRPGNGGLEVRILLPAGAAN